MRDADSVVADLRNQGVKFWVEDDRLRYLAPPGVMTPAVVANLRERKDDIVRSLTASGSEGAAPVSFAPATFQQQWLWQYLERSGSWNHLLYAFALRITGESDERVLVECIGDLVRRHSILRTRLVLRNGELQQSIASAAAASAFTVEDLQGIPVLRRETEGRQQVEAFFNRITGPDAADLFAVKILRVGEREHILAIALHHIVSDACSLSLMWRDLWLSYSARSSRQRVCESRPAVAEYGDYARWQHQTASGWTERHSRYWHDALEGTPRLRFPIERVLSPGREAPSAELSLLIEEGLATEVREFARREKSLVAFTLFAVYVVVVGRWCGQDDLLIPFATTGRHLPEHDQMIGFFSYYLYVRLKLKRGASFRVLLRTVMRDCYAALEHQDYTRALAGRPELAMNPSFNWVSVGHAEIMGAPPRAVLERLGDALKVEPFPFQRVLQEAVVDDGEESPEQGSTGVVFYDSGQQFQGTFYCKPEQAQTVRVFMKEYVQAIETFVRDPERLVQ